MPMSGSASAIKQLTQVLCFVLAAAALSACSTTSTPSAPGARDAVVASGHPEWPPIMFQSGAAIDGAGPALLRKIFGDLGVAVSFPHTGTWDEVQAKARSGEVDILVAAYKTAEREGYMVYSDPYTTDPVAIFVARGRTFPFSSWEELVGKRGIAMVGDSYGQTFDDFAAARLALRRVTTSAEAFALVSSGQADYLLYSFYAGNDTLKKTGTASQFESLPKFVNEEHFYITISKQSRFVSYLPLINQQIAKYKADGTVAALIAQYASR
jgi:polar amino acid transport system substrate-binding protein